jgi:hypothetical protein
MDPISIGLSVVGLGISLFGASQQANNAKHQAAVSMDIAHQEMGINSEKQKAMELNARRQQLETYRNMQRARAQATQAAVNQGASQGSGLQGGLGQIASQGLFNLVGINSALETGRNIAGYNDAISQDKIKMAQLGGEAADAQMITSIGGSIMKVGPTVGPMFSGFGNLFGGGGNYSGTPGASNTGGLY